MKNTNFKIVSSYLPLVTLTLSLSLDSAFGQIRIPDGSLNQGIPLSADVTISSATKTATGTNSQIETGKFWRSADGKTRQDNAVGSVIGDPVAGATTSLNHAEQSATIFRRSTNSQSTSQSIRESVAPGAPVELPSTSVQSKNGRVVESLGAKEIDGFKVTGTRITMPNPVGMRLGIVTIEQWFAPAVGLYLYSKQTRPDGETIQQYDNVRLGELPTDVFAIPNGYTVRVALTGGQVRPPPGQR